jgi:MFS family permease
MTAAPVTARPAGARLLAVGIVALEFAAAVSSFVSSTLLPTVSRELAAGDQLGLLVAGSTLGLFVALPLAARVVRRLGPRRTLAAGLVGYVGGAVLAATARVAGVFAAGQFVGGVAGGLLAVFGVSSAIQYLDPALRMRVIAAASAMWIVPALVGPPATLALEHAVGWRWALLVPVPIVLIGRSLVVRAARPDRDDDSPLRPVWRTLLVPCGVGALVLGGRPGSWWPVAAVGTLVALAGVATIMPGGTIRLRRGAPAALGAMLLFATGYFGADSLITVLLTDGYGTSVARAAIVLSAAPLAWASTSLLGSRLRRRGGPLSPAGGLALTAAGAAVLGGALLSGALLGSTAFSAALIAWTAAGVGVGLAYPSLYLLCTPAADSGLTAAELAAAVITAEAFGGLLGRAAGGAVVSLAGTAGLSRSGGLAAAYLLFAVFLAAAAAAATRAASRPSA